MKLTIERMNPSHISEIAELERECFSTPWSENALTEEIDNPNAYFCVAIVEDRVVGYGGLHSVCGENYIDNIAVTSAYRKKGVATKILEALEMKATEKNGEFISLEVRKSNEAAIKLYEKCGYAHVGIRKRFYQNPTEDGIIMTKEL